MTSISTASSDQSPPDALLQIVSNLRIGGNITDAVALLEHLHALYPADNETLTNLIELHAAQGQHVEALQALLALKKNAPDPDQLLTLVRTHLPKALDQFNRHAAANQIGEAERLATIFAQIVPGNVEFLNAALTCAAALGQHAAAKNHAESLLKLQPSHQSAQNYLQQSQPKSELGAKVDAVLNPASVVHPLLRLRDLHDVMSLILCEPLTSERRFWLASLYAAANNLEIAVPPDSEYAGWSKHYRLALKAISPEALDTPHPTQSIEPPIEFVAASGQSRSWMDLRLLGAKSQAQAVFFAAADRKYVELYARWYIKSILKYCDVPCLIIVHVIGGAGQLREIANEVGIDDQRLIFAGDTFDANSVTTKCYDTPPKGLIPLPVAHFQSVRFQRLPVLLRTLGLPVFVSDIDLILQRGVSDLLERSRQADIVLNENTASLNAGSRLTANLLLANPTREAFNYLDRVRHYLDRALAEPEVSRWIDQFALLMAKHRSEQNPIGPRFEYFDTSTDINNVMYRAYQDHPFRFLSLYHGFDTSSLEGQPRVLGTNAA